jgi:hypothetical protein
MTERRLSVFWPLGYRPYAVAGLVVLGVTLLGTRQMLAWPYQEWPGTSALFHQRLDLAGPVAAFFGAYVSGRLTPPSRLFAQPRFARDHAQFILQNLLPLAAVTTAAYVAGLVPALVLTVKTATYGSLDLAVAATGLLGLQAYLVSGWLLGLLARTAFIAPVAFALAFAATLAGYSGDTFAALAPVLHISPMLGFHEAGPLVTFRIAFLFILVVVGLLAANGILARRGFDRRAPGLRHAALWLLPVAFLVFGLVRTPALFAGDAELPSVCGDASGVQVCVHQGHRSQLAPLVSTVEPVLDRVGAQNLPFDRIVDRALRGPYVRPDDSHTFYYDLSPTLSIDSPMSEIAGIAAGADACRSRFELNADNEQTRNMWMLARRLAGDHKNGPDKRFGALSDAELRTWVTAHRQQVASCGVTGDILP